MVIDTAESEVLLAGGGTIITATHRLARQIRWRYDQARAASGAGAWPSADVLPLDAWLRRTWESATLRDATPGRLRLLSDDETRLVWRRVLVVEDQERLDAGVLVPLVAAAWRLCQAWGIAATALHAAADTDDARAFAHWVDAYVGQLQARGWTDNGGLLNTLARGGAGVRSGGEARLGFAGFEPWTPAVASLGAALEGAGVTVGRLAPRRRDGPRRLVTARDASEEFARACRWAAAHAHPDGGVSVAIVMPNLEECAGHARRIGLDILAPGWQLREPPVRPLTVAAGRQLADYPLVHCALDLLQVVATDVAFDQASRLLRSCYVAGAAEERAGRARAELRLRRLPLDRFRLADVVAVLGEGATLVAGQWGRAGSLASRERSRRLPPSQWAAHFTAWLAAAGWPGIRALDSEEYQAAEAWQRMLESFAGTDEIAGTLTLPGALGLLGQQARDRPFEPESADGAVQVLSVREAEGQEFSALWICGMTADQWPPPPRPHPLVPLSLQLAAGIPEAAAATLEAHTRRRFARLLASADDLVLSWPREQAEAETLPSPLLAELDLTASTDDTPVALHPDREQVAASAEMELVFADPPPSLPPESAVAGGARVLAMQAVCPARAFVEFRLLGTPLEPPARPLDLATRGRILHRLLEQLYRLEPCAEGLGAIETTGLRALFEPVVSAVLDEFLPPGDPFLDGLRPLESERLWALLLTLRGLDAERPGFRVMTEVARQVRIGALVLGIRLDRLDRLADGGELVIDYKTGRFQSADWKAHRLQESQLPLYAVTSGSRGVAVIQCRVPTAQLRGVGDAALALPGIKSAADFFGQNDLDWNGALARWQLQLENLAGEFVAGDFRVNPADRKWATGQFAGITRIHEFLPVPDHRDGQEGQDE